MLLFNSTVYQSLINKKTFIASDLCKNINNKVDEIKNIICKGHLKVLTRLKLQEILSIVK